MKKLLLLFISLVFFFGCSNSNKKKQIVDYSTSVNQSQVENEVNERQLKYYDDLSMSHCQEWNGVGLSSRGAVGTIYVIENDKRPTGDVYSIIVGEKKYLGFINDGLKDGLWYGFDSKGNIKEEIIYNDGYKQRETNYYSNGEKKSEFNYQDGCSNGFHTSYCENGDIWARHFYEMGNIKKTIYDIEEYGTNRCK